MIVYPDSTVETPLFAFRAPVRHVEQFAREIPGRGRFSYPTYLRSGGVVATSFVVGWDGEAEKGSFRIVSSSNADLSDEVRKMVASQTFSTLGLAGCSVRALVQRSVWFKPVSKPPGS